MLFADDAGFVPHSEEQLQRLLDNFTLACKDFALTISLSKTQILTSNTTSTPALTIDNNYYALSNVSIVYSFTYLGSTFSQNLSLDQELNKRLGKPHQS